MIYKLVIVFVFLFSLKTFSAEPQKSDKSSSKDQLAKKQLEMIIQSIKEEIKTEISEPKS